MHSRPTERAELRRRFDLGQSAQMLGPRRLGKTWLMNAVAEDLRADGWVAVVVDVEGMRTEVEFLKALCGEIEKQLGLKEGLKVHFLQRFKQLVAGDWEGNPLSIIGAVDPRDFADTLIAAIQAQDRDAVIFIDEISLFVMERLADNESDTLSFLYHLRKLRQAYPRVRWLLTGSIGLDTVARQSNLLGALVDLETFPLDPFDQTAARAYLAHLCRGRQVLSPSDFDDPAFAYLAAELGWLSPYYLKLIADRISPTGPPGPTGLPLATAADIDRAFEALLQPIYRVHFAIWEDHVRKNFSDPVSVRLHAILDICSEQSAGETTDTLQGKLSPAEGGLARRELMNLLTNLNLAGFLHEDDGRWRFTSGLLRRYWLKYVHA